MPSDFRQEFIEQFNERNREGAETLRKIARVLAEANQNLCNLQIELTQASLSENSQHLTSMQKHAAGTPITLEQWSMLIQSNAERLVAASSAWARLTSQTVIALNQLIEQSLQPNRRSDETAETGALTERRVSARMIVFPDRRNRMMASEIVIDPGQYDDRQRQAARKKGAA